MYATKVSASAACTHHTTECTVTAWAGVMPRLERTSATARANGLNTVNHGMC